MTNFGVIKLQIVCIWRPYVRSNGNDIVDDILQNDGRYIPREREEEIYERFTSVRKPGCCVKYIRDKKKWPGSESYSTRMEKYVVKERVEDAVGKEKV